MNDIPDFHALAVRFATAKGIVTKLKNEGCPRKAALAHDGPMTEDDIPRGCVSVLPALYDDGSSVTVDAIDGGKRSTNGIPDSLVLCFTAPDGTEQRVLYESIYKVERVGLDTKDLAAQLDRWAT